MRIGSFSKSRQGHKAALLVAASAAACLSAAAAMVAWPGGASAGAQTTIVLGETPTTPRPACPREPCQAIGSVTGFQASNGTDTLPFLVPADGRIVAYTLTLGEPSPHDRNFFNGFFGMPPEARIGIVRRVPGTNPVSYRLLRQSPIVVLSPYFGKKVRFRLATPLPAAAGNIVVLTVPTWAPVLALDQSNANKWRASRQPNRCLDDVDIRKGRPQQVPGVARVYACLYTTARLLYTVTLVEDA